MTGNQFGIKKRNVQRESSKILEAKWIQKERDCKAIALQMLGWSEAWLAFAAWPELRRLRKSSPCAWLHVSCWGCAGWRKETAEVCWEPSTDIALEGLSSEASTTMCPSPSRSKQVPAANTRTFQEQQGLCRASLFCFVFCNVPACLGVSRIMHQLTRPSAC